MFLGALYTMLFELFSTCCNLSEVMDLVALTMEVPYAILVFSHFALKLIICTYVPIVAFRCRLAATGAEKRPTGRTFWCVQTCRKAIFGSIFLVYSDIIGGRGATGMGPQKKDCPLVGVPFSSSDFGHVF